MDRSLSPEKPIKNWASLPDCLTFTPFHHWRWEHSVHHATTGDLSRRGMGDIWTLTVKEYLGEFPVEKIFIID